jgi:hypothetical protein
MAEKRQLSPDVTVKKRLPIWERFSEGDDAEVQNLDSLPLGKW